MIRNKRTFTVTTLVLITLFNLSSSTPVLDSLIYDAAGQAACSPYVCSRETSTSYHVGKVYQYTYDVKATTEMQSASPQQQSSVSWAAKVKVHVLSACELSLQLENGEGMDPVLEQHPVQFAIEYGQVRRVCVHPDEPEWAVNIKKGVISAFQSFPTNPEASVNITETDVVGTCLTEYQDNGDNSFTKIKHMSTCQNNQKLFQFALNLPDVNMQKLPFITSQHVCDVTLHSDGKMASSSCQEVHIFQPFSSAASGAVTKVEQTLTFSTEATSNAQFMTQAKETSLIYVHEEEDKDQLDQSAHVLQTLAQFWTTEEASRPEMFSDLVHSMRHLTHAQLLSIFYNGITDDQTRKVVLDALPLLKTDAAITLMSDIIESGSLPLGLVDTWFATLPFYKNPTRGMLSVVLNFLRGEPRPSALLGVASLVNTYCSSQNDCQYLPEVSAIISRYEQLLGSQCHTMDQAEEDRLILTLKGLRSMGHLKLSHETIEKCYQDSDASMFVRLAALDSIRWLNCREVNDYDFQKKLFATFQDTKVDSELRIGAYLALMECPSGSLVNTVKSVLVHEPVNQVGSFVWTHLTNLQESQSLSDYKKAVKTLVGSEFLQNKWKTDVRKFSRYFESSYFSQDLNIGATTDAQLVFSQDSYLPRSAMVNLTANVFGESLQLFEISGRVEGLEPTFESLFGPDGYFREDSLHKLLQGLRYKRNVADTISDFQQTYNQDSYNERPRGNFYLRSFGRDIHYSSFEGLPDLATQFSSNWPMSWFTSSNDIDISRSSVFLDGKVVLPTVAGTPLSVAANGTSTVSFKSQNEFELGDLFQHGNAKLNLKVYPTATLQIAATMTVDNKWAKSGLKSMNKLHTSTFLDGKFVMEGGKMIKAQINVPKEKMDVIDVSVDYFSLNSAGNYEAIISKNVPQKFDGCTPSMMNKVVGMKLCGSALYHENPQDNLDLVFAGPFHMRVSLEKVDTFDKYSFEYQWMQKDASTSVINAVLDTPGSSINRRSSLKVDFDHVNFNDLTLSMEIPVGQVDINAVYHWTDEKKLLKASLAMQKEILCSIHSSLSKPNPGRHDAQVTIVFKKMELVHWTGGLTSTSTKMNAMTALNSHFLPSPLSASAALLNMEDSWDLRGQISTHWVEADVNGIFQQTDTSFSIKGELGYQTTDGTLNKVAIQSSYKINSVGSLDKHLFFLLVDPRNYPAWNSALNVEIQMSDSYLESQVKARIGRHTHEFHQLLSSQASTQYQELLVLLAFKAPELGLDYKVDFEHRLGSKQNINRLELKIPGWIELNTHLSHLKDDLKQNLDAGLAYGSIDLAAGMEMKRAKNDETINGNAYVRWGPESQPNSKAEAEFELKKLAASDVNYAIDTRISIPNLAPLKAHGLFRFSDNAAELNIQCQQGHAKFEGKATLEHTDTSFKCQAVIETAAIHYSVGVFLRNDAIKSLHAELELDQKYVLNAVARRGFQDVLFDLSYGNAQRILLKAELSPQRVVTSFEILGHNGKIEAAFQDNSLTAQGSLDGETISIQGRYQPVPTDFLLDLSLESSIPMARLIQLNLKHSLEQNLSSKASLVWNDNIHEIKVTGERSSSNWVQLETTSAYEPLDGLFIHLENSAVGKKNSNAAILQYKKDEIKLSTMYDNSKPKEGVISLETPWDSLKQVSLGFLFNYGRQIQLDTYLNWNHAPVAAANVTGHILPSDIKLDVHVSKESIGEATGGFAYKKTSLGSSSSMHLKYGDNSVSLDGEYKTMPLVANVKLDATTSFLMTNAEASLFTGYGAIDIKGHLDVDNTRVAVLQWNSWFNSILEHRFNAKMQYQTLELTVVANNNKGRDMTYEVTHVKDQKLISSFGINADYNYDDEVKNMDFKGTIVLQGEKSSIDLHNSCNRTHVDTLLSFQAKQNVVELKHHTHWKTDDSTGKKTLHSSFELTSPFDYMKKSSCQADFYTQWQAGISAGGKLDFKANDDQVLIEFDAKSKQDKEVTQIDIAGKLDGTLGSSGFEGQVKMVDQGFFATTSLTKDQSQPLLIRLALTRPDQGASLDFEVEIPNESAVHLKGEWQVDKDEEANPQMRLKSSFVVNNESIYEISSKIKLEGSGIKVFAKLLTKYDFAMELSGSLIKKHNEMSAELSITDVVQFKSDLSWEFGENKFSVKGDVNVIKDVDKYHLGLFVDFNSEASLVMSRNERFWNSLVKMTNDETTFSVHGQVKTNDNEGDIGIQYEKAANAFTAEYKCNDKVFKLNGHFEVDTSSYGLKTTFLSEGLPAMKKFDIEALLDMTKPSETKLAMKGSADNNHKIEITGLLKPDSGELSVMLHLPVVNLEDVQVKGQFEISSNGGKVKLETGPSQDFVLEWKSSPGESLLLLSTPFQSLTSLSLSKIQQSNQNINDLTLHLKVNDEDLAVFKGSFEPQNRVIDIKFNSILASMSEICLTANMRSATDFDLRVLYNDLIEARLFGKATQGATEFSAKLLSSKFGANYISSFRYDVNHSNEKVFELLLVGNDHKSTMLSKLLPDQALIKVESWLLDGPKVIQADWDLDQGVFQVIAKDGNNELVTGQMLFAGINDNDPYDGTANITAKAFFLANDINIYTKFDIGGLSKEAEMSMAVGGHFITLSTLYKMTEDTFNGKMLWMSSISGYESATLNARYNIAVEPTAYLSIERNGKMDFIKTKLTFDSVIPTVRIMTSFPYFERLVLKGSLNNNPRHKQGDIVLSRNDNPMLALSWTMKSSDNWEDGEVIIDILTPISNWETINMEAGWKGENDPYAVKLKLSKGGEEISAKGKLSMRQREFSLSMVTPFENYESISLSGKLGTTSLGKHFGVAYENNAVRRDLSFAYDYDAQQRALVQIKTPLDDYKSIKIRTIRMADIGNVMDFGFETQGVNQKEFAMGLKYDFSKGLSDGMLLFKLKAPQILDWMGADIETKLDYSYEEVIFYFKKDGSVLASAKLTKQPHEINGDVTTPIPGYEKINLNLRSDFDSFSVVSVTINGKLASLRVDRVQHNGFDVKIVTPMKGYEDIEVQARYINNEVLEITVFKEEKKITKLIIDARVVDGMKLDVHWEATSSLWAKLSLSYEEGHILMTFKAPNKDWSVSSKYTDDGTVSITVLEVNIDGQILNYSSERVVKEGHITGQSKFFTNMESINFMAKKQETNYELKYSWDFKSPWSFVYKSSDDDQLTLLLDLNLDVEYPTKASLTGLLSYPELWQDDIKIEIELETDGSSTVDINVKYNNKQIKIELRSSALRSDNVDVKANLKSNISGFENLSASVTWLEKNGKAKGEVTLNKDGTKLFQGILALDSEPFRMKMRLQYGNNFQELEVKLSSPAPYTYKWSVSTDGFFKLNLALLFKTARGMETVEVKLASEGVLGFKPLTLSVKIATKHLDNNYGMTAVFEDKRGGNKAKLEFNAEIQSPTMVDVKVGAEVMGMSGEATLNFDLESQQKSFFARIAGMGKWYEVDGKAIWSPYSSDITARYEVDDGTKIEFVGKRQGFSEMSYVLDLLGKRFELTLDIAVADALDWNIDANFKMVDANQGTSEKAKLTLSSNSGHEPMDVEMNGEVSVNQRSYGLHFMTSGSGSEFEVVVDSKQSGQKYQASYKKEGDGKRLTVDAGGKTFEIFQSFSTGANPMKLKVNDNFFDVIVDGQVNVQDKTGSITIGRGEKFLLMHGSAVLAGSDVILTLAAATNDDSELCSLQFGMSYPLSVVLSVQFQKNRITLEASQDQIKFEYNGKAQIKVDLKITNTDEEKSAHLEAVYNSQSLNVQAKSSTGKVEFEIESTIAQLRKVDLDVTYNPSMLEIEAEYNDLSLEVGFENSPDVLQFKADVFDEHKLEASYDKNSNEIKIDSNIAGKEMTLQASVSQNHVSVKVTEPFFSSSGLIHMQGSWERNNDGGIDFNAKGDINAIDYQMQAKVGATYLNIVISRGLEEWRFESQVTDEANGKSMTIQVKGANMQTFKVQGSYEKSDDTYKGQVDAELPPFNKKSSILVEVTSKFPQEASLEASVLHNGEVLARVKTGLAALSDLSYVKAAFTIFVPALSMSKEVGVEVVYKAISALNFEIKAEIMTPTQDFKAGVMFELQDSGFDSEIVGGYGQFEAFLKCGGSLRSVGNAKVLNAYLNGLKLNFELQENADFKLSLEGQRSQEDLFYSSLVLSPEHFKIDLEYDHGSKLRLEAKGDDVSHLLVLFKIDNSRLDGGFSFTHNQWHKSVEIMAEYGAEGKIEITVGDKHTMNFQWPTQSSRVTRAAFSSPDYGDYEFYMDQDVMKGILVLNIGQDIHKLSYEINEEQGYELTASLQTSFLPNGHASVHVVCRPVNHAHSLTISLNNEHFVSLNLGYNQGNDVHAEVTLTTSLLSSPIIAKVQWQRKQSTLIGLAYLKMSSMQHTLEVKYNRLEPTLHISISSPLLPGGSEWRFEGSFVEAIDHYEIKALADVVGERWELQGNVSAQSPTQFQGSLVAQSPTLSLTTLDFAVHLEQSSSLLQFELTTPHRDFPRIKMMMSLDQADSDFYVGNAVLAVPTVSPLEAQFFVPTQQWSKNNINATVSNLGHRLELNMNWDLMTTTGKWLDLVIDGADGQKTLLAVKLADTALELKATSTFEILDQLLVVVSWDEEMSLAQGGFQTRVQKNNDQVSVEIDYKLRDNSKGFEVAVHTPFEGHETYALNLGYEDSDRKAAKAHLAYPGAEAGFQFDYFFESLSDFHFEVEVDLPIPELRVTKIKLGHKLARNEHQLAVGGEWDQWNCAMEYRVKLDQAALLLDFSGRYNDYALDVTQIIDVMEMEANAQFKLKIPCGTLEIPLSINGKDKDMDLNIMVNDQSRLAIHHNERAGITSAEVKDLWSTIAVKLGIIRDHTVLTSSTLEIVWDTTRPEETTELISISWEKDSAYHAFNAQVTWPSQETVAISEKVEKTPGSLKTTASVIENGQRTWGLDIAFQTEYEGQVIRHEEDLTLQIPSHKLNFLFSSRQESNKIDTKMTAILADMHDSSKQFGLAFSHHYQIYAQDDLLWKYALERIGHEGQTYMVTYRLRQDYRAIGMDISHSEQSFKDVTLQAMVDTSNSNDDRISVHSTLMYKFALRPNRRIDNYVQLDMSNKQFSMKHEDKQDANENSYGIDAHISTKSTVDLKAVLSANGQSVGNLMIAVDTDKPNMQSQVSWEDCAVEMMGGLKDPSLIGFNVKSQCGQEETTTPDDIDIAISLSPDGRVLKVDFEWRPEWVSESRYALASLAQTAFNGGNDQVTQEILGNMEILQLTMRQSIQDGYDDLKEVLSIDPTHYEGMFERLQANVQSLYINQYLTGFVNLYDYTTDFLSQGTLQMLKVSQNALVTIQPVLTNAKEFALHGLDVAFHQMSNLLTIPSNALERLFDKMAQIEFSEVNAGEQMKITVHWLHDSLQTWRNIYKEICDYLALIPTEVGHDIDADLHSFLKDLSAYVKKFKAFNEALTFYFEYQSWFEEFHFSSRVQEVTSDVRSYLMDVGRHLSQLHTTLVNYWNTTTRLVQRTMEKYPVLAYGMSVGKKLVRVSKALMEQMSMENNLRQWLRQFMSRADAIASTVVRLIDVLYHKKDLMSYSFEYDLHNGKIMYTQLMPFQWHEFQDSPDIFKIAGLMSTNPTAEEEISVDFKALQHDLLQVIDSVSQALKSQSVIPPFSATALVAGNSHIITFDQFYYEFIGPRGCSYLLTSDFAHGRFSVIANYDLDMRRTSLDVVSDGQTINIDTVSSGDDDLIKVTLNKRTTELPLQFDHTYVHRQDKTIVVENDEGLRVACNTLYNICTVTISGWYFGKTGGLLGLYDNEPSNDWITSERQIVDSIEDFAQSWSVTTERACPIAPANKEVSVEPTAEELQVCDQMFADESSSLMPCFASVDPKPFGQICSSDVRSLENHADRRSGMCSAAAAYIEKCQQVGIELWMPASCVRCQMGRDTMRNGESSRIEDNVARSADVVFIVEQSQCLTDIQLQDLPYLVDRSLASRGMSGNRYALVSYGGKDRLAQPHIFTSGSRSFADVVPLTMSISNLPSDGENGNVFDALQFAARLNFRPGVSKSFVLIRCDTSEALTPRAYGDSMTMLVEQGIVLHALTPLDLSLKGSRVKLDSKMFGFTKKSVITAGRFDKDLRRQLKDPKDHLSTLAQESGGSAFDLDRLSSSKKMTAKKAKTMVGKSVAHLTQATQCEVCDCLASADGKGRLMCHRCVLPYDIVLQNLETMLE